MTFNRASSPDSRPLVRATRPSSMSGPPLSQSAPKRPSMDLDPDPDLDLDLHRNQPLEINFPPVSGKIKVQPCAKFGTGPALYPCDARVKPVTDPEKRPLAHSQEWRVSRSLTSKTPRRLFTVRGEGKPTAGQTPAAANSGRDRQRLAGASGGQRTSRDKPRRGTRNPWKKRASATRRQRRIEARSHTRNKTLKTAPIGYQPMPKAPAGATSRG